MLFVAGGAMLALVGPSFFWKAGFISQWPGSVTHVELQNASIRLRFIEATPHIFANNDLYVRRNKELELKAAFLPSLSLKYAPNPDRARIWRGGLPLWLLAAICLAWPVTSFIIARRRRKGRGFEVEAKAGGAVSTSDS